jgi:hypothetical protein
MSAEGVWPAPPVIAAPLSAVALLRPIPLVPLARPIRVAQLQEPFLDQWMDVPPAKVLVVAIERNADLRG